MHYERDDWYHPGPETRKRNAEIEARSREICSEMMKEAGDHGFNSPVEWGAAAECESYKSMINKVKELFRKNKYIKHVLVFGGILKWITITQNLLAGIMSYT